MTEQSDADEHNDPILCALLRLAKQVVLQDPSLKMLMGVKDTNGGLLSEMVQALFDYPASYSNSTNFLPPPKCKTAHSRFFAFELLAELSRGCPANTLEIIKHVAPFHLKTHNGGMKRNIWNFEPKHRDEKPRAGSYVGLRNLGGICYMNSLVQQLFMLPSLRHNILSIASAEDDDKAKAGLIYGLQYIMAHLQESQKQYVSLSVHHDTF